MPWPMNYQDPFEKLIKTTREEVKIQLSFISLSKSWKVQAWSWHLKIMSDNLQNRVLPEFSHEELSQVQNAIFSNVINSLPFEIRDC